MRQLWIEDSGWSKGEKKERKKHAHAQARTHGEGEQSWLHPKQQEDLLQSVCTWDRCCSKWRWTTDTKLLPLTCLWAAAAAEDLSQSLSDTSTVIYPPLWWWRRQLSGLPCAAVWRQIELHNFTPLKASAVCVVHLLTWVQHAVVYGVER